MIAGVHAPDSGKILIDGTEVTIASTNDSEAHGIATIHQELNLVPTLSVAENIMLGRTPKRFGLVNYKHLNAQAQAALNLIGWMCRSSKKWVSWVLRSSSSSKLPKHYP